MCVEIHCQMWTWCALDGEVEARGNPEYLAVVRRNIARHREAFNSETQDGKKKRQKRREDIAAMRQVVRRLQPIAAP